MSASVPSPHDSDPLQPAAWPSGAVAVFMTGEDALAPLVEAALTGEGMTCRQAGSSAELVALLGERTEPVIVLADDVASESGAIVDALSEDERTRCGVIVLSRRCDLEAAVDAMRRGAIDFISWPCETSELVVRVRTGLERLRASSDHAKRVERLERACKKLDGARREMSEQVENLCQDLAGACDEIDQDMAQATLSSEFGALVGQELDVESLLRTTLEYLLTKTGPTNAAVFLPTGHEDYSLGAYVNCDVPRDSADVLLDHLADIIAPRFEEESRLRRFATQAELEDALDDDAGWLDGSDVVVFSCRDEDECIAVFALFRDRMTPFTPQILSDLEVMRQLFAKQLAKVVRIHHRHMPPQDQWPGFDVEEGEDFGGLAA